MKHILIIMETLVGGGAEKALVDLFRYIDYQSYQITLCLLFQRGIYIKQIPEQVKTIYVYNDYLNFIQDETIYRGAFNPQPAMNRLTSELELKYFAIISFLEGFSLRYHSYITERTSNNISWIHCNMENFHWTSIAFNAPEEEEQTYQKMQRLVFVSDNARKGFNRIFCNHSKQEVIYNIVDKKQIFSYVDSFPIARDQRFTVCLVGRLIDVKAVDRLVNVAKMLEEDGYHLMFWIIGDGERREYLERLVKYYNLESCICFWGARYPSYSYIKSADVLISTSISEGLSLVICEALCLEIPVVATKTAGALELLDDGKYGVLTEHDEVSIYNGLKSLIDNKRLFRKYKRKSLERSQIFKIDKTMRAFYGLFGR